MTIIYAAERLLASIDWSRLQALKGNGEGVRRALRDLLASQSAEAAERSYWEIQILSGHPSASQATPSDIVQRCHRIVREGLWLLFREAICGARVMVAGMYELYIGNKNYSSWSLRPWVLMRELALPFNEHLKQFGRDAFRSFSPTGKVPLLRDGDTVVWDSLGITEYLAERHPGVWPTDPHARAWARCASAEMHSSFTTLRERCTMNCGVRVQLRDMPVALARDIARIAELWNEGLGLFGGPYLTGAAFTAVDAFFAPVAFRVQTYGLGLDERAASYGRRLLALPSLQEWYVAALAEPWRDPDHEEELARTGTVTEDLRRA